MNDFEFVPQEWVCVKLLECKGRINRCIQDGGPQPLYQVLFITNGECKSAEFYEDELEKL